ncbi:CPBP family intramembrane metalloprotease [Bacillus sp. AGMB 02131]|uniref:CPBP family intramembrane metalloprotease n=1 Tax=Peribacillus faecalis TaxID=2772559 RepID=A0A927HC16_9BACI|nr:CPBP family intramembrane glutamic endopeptidase [Peribacillus faecalis]MBD3110360.1 CPBP family intramembrane metalloprotease [Peribacillus faecalis]
MKNKQAELLKNISDETLILNVWLTQGIVIFATFILGLFLFDDWVSFGALFQWDDVRILTIGVTTGIGIVLLDLLLMKWLPASFYDDGGINQRIFRSISIPHVVILSLVVAFCEELLFRGVIQTNTNLWIASLIFALVHYRYLFNLFLFCNVTVLSFLIGLLYDYTENLLVTITAHFIIDCLLGIYMNTYRKHTRSECV